MHIHNILNTHNRYAFLLKKRIKHVNNIWNWILSLSQSQSSTLTISVSIPGDLPGGSAARLWRMIWADTLVSSQTRQEVTRALSDFGLSIPRLWLRPSVTRRLQLTWAEVWRWSAGWGHTPSRASPGPGQPRVPGTGPSPAWAASWPRGTPASPTRSSSPPSPSPVSRRHIMDRYSFYYQYTDHVYNDVLVPLQVD